MLLQFGEIDAECAAEGLHVFICKVKLASEAVEEVKKLAHFMLQKYKANGMAMTKAQAIASMSSLAYLMRMSG